MYSLNNYDYKTQNPLFNKISFALGELEQTLQINLTLYDNEDAYRPKSVLCYSVLKQIKLLSLKKEFTPKRSLQFYLIFVNYAVREKPG